MVFLFIAIGLVAGALIWSGVLFAHRRLTTYLATAGAIGQGMWLLFTLLDRTFLAESDSRLVFAVGAGVFLLSALLLVRRFSWPRFGWADVPVLIVTGVVLVAAWSVVSVNGWQTDGGWLTHGFYNGDTATFMTLVERSLFTGGLVDTNPFAGGGELEYPTLLHAGVATLVSFLQLELTWSEWLPAATLLQAALTIPLFFLLWDLVSPEPKERWAIWTLQAGIVGYVLALSWDNYVYPQTHFFLTGLFILLVGLLWQSHRAVGGRQLLWLGPAYFFTVILLLANAVSGTAAMVLMLVLCLLRLADRHRGRAEKLMFVGLALSIVILFFAATPGEPALGIVPGFSYTAAAEMGRFAPVFALLVVGILSSLSRQTLVSGGVAALALLAIFTFTFSQRDIVVENSSRFFYHALLIGFPLLMPPLLQIYYWLKRELLHTSHTWAELVTGGGMVAVAFVFWIMPPAASVVSAHDNLWFNDTHRVSTAQIDTFRWVREHTPPQAVFLAAPEAPFEVPLFTGRAVLRANYWLSPDDYIFGDVVAAFEGNVAAREQILSQADYLYLRAGEKELWKTLPYRQVFANEATVIYQLRE